MSMAEVPVYITRDAILAALRQAIAPYIGQQVMIGEQGHGKGPHWHSCSGTLWNVIPAGCWCKVRATGYGLTPWIFGRAKPSVAGKWVRPLMRR